MRQLIKRIKLLTARKELVDYFLECNSNYDKIMDCCKQKEWKMFDNMHKTLNILETQMDKENNEGKSPRADKWYIDRAVDLGLKTYIITNR